MDSIKINFDGSFYASSLSRGVGVVVHYWRGFFVHAKSEGCYVNSVFVTECLAARLALATTHGLGLSCVILEHDSLEVTSLLDNSREKIPWVISSLIHDCYHFIQTFSCFS